MAKKTEYQKNCEDVQILVEMAKIRNGMTREELANCLCVSVQTLASWIKDPGQMKMCVYWTIKKLAE